MAVARHAVNCTGCGRATRSWSSVRAPIGLGAVIAFKLSAAKSVVVADIIPSRLAKRSRSAPTAFDGP
jgi:hypothetical protein